MSSFPLNAVDAVTPAFARMTTLLFKPFRIARWVRFAIVAFLAGELSGGGCNMRVPANLNLPSHQKGSQSFMANLPQLDPAFWHRMIPVIALLAVLGVVIWLIFLYVNSVMRFVLFDAVLSGNISIREGWRRWRERGTMFFPWQLGYAIITTLAMILVVGVPVLMAWRAGLFRNPSEHLATLILSGLGLLFLLLLISLVSVVIFVLTKDFVVPIMMFEGIGPIRAWGRLKPMISGSKLSYAGYLLFKLVLVIAAAIVTGIAATIIMIVIFVPLAIIAVALGFGFAGLTSGAGLTAGVITLIVVGAVIVVGLALAINALVSAPAAVFFRAYALHFFGSRYEPLRAVMYPDAPPQVPPGFVPQPAL